MQSESALVTKYVNTLEHLTLFFFCNAIAHTSMYSYIRRMHRCTLHVFMCTCVCVCMYGAQHALEWMGAAPGTRVCVSCAEWERSGVILPGVWSGFFESRSICALSRSKILLHPTSLCLDTIKEKKNRYYSSQLFSQFLTPVFSYERKMDEFLNWQYRCFL